MIPVPEGSQSRKSRPGPRANPLPIGIDIDKVPHPFLETEALDELQIGTGSGTAFSRRIFDKIYADSVNLENRAVFSEDRNARKEKKVPLTPAKVEFIMHHTMKRFPIVNLARHDYVKSIKSTIYDRMNQRCPKASTSSPALSVTPQVMGYSQVMPQIAPQVTIQPSTSYGTYNIPGLPVLQ